MNRTTSQRIVSIARGIDPTIVWHIDSKRSCVIIAPTSENTPALFDAMDEAGFFVKLVDRGLMRVYSF